MRIAYTAVAAAIIASAATFGASAEFGDIVTFTAMVLVVAVSAACIAAMVAAGTNIFVAAARAAELAFDIFVPRKSVKRNDAYEHCKCNKKHRNTF